MPTYDLHTVIERHLKPLLDTAETYGKCKHNPLVSTQDFRSISIQYATARETFVAWAEDVLAGHR